MSRSTLGSAKIFMQRRKFNLAITLLESRSDFYKDNFEYNILLGVSCLYAGDIGSSSEYFKKARTMRLTDVTLLLGQAALFLRRGDTDRAIQYYMDILDLDPQNRIAKKAMEFIRRKGDYGTICQWVDSGRIEEFYPPIQKSLEFFVPYVFLLGLIFLLFMTGVRFFSEYKDTNIKRITVTGLNLTDEEKKDGREKDLSSGVYSYILTGKSIHKSYEKAKRAFESYDDNVAQIEINRILNSNASVTIKQKARILMNYLEEPTFDSIKSNIPFLEVQNEIPLYLDCFVVWSGRISNVVTEPLYSFDLLVGYEKMEKVEGIVKVYFDKALDITPDKSVKVLGRVEIQDGKLILKGKSLYQSVKY